MQKSKRCITAGVCLGLMTLMSSITYGEESTSGETSNMENTEEKISLQGKMEEWYPGLTFLKGVNISGYLDLTYIYNFNDPDSRNNTLRVFDTESNGFGVRMFQLMLDKPTQEPGDVGFRVKLDFGEDARILTPFDTARDEFDIQELYITYKAPLGEGLDITFGHFVTLHGVEVIESKDNFNISRGLLFGYAIPFTHTGLMFGYPFTENVSGKIGVVNGWDNIDDNNSGKTIHAMVNVSPTEQFNFIVGGTYGPEKTDNDSDQRALIDLIASYKPMDELTLIGNYDYGEEEDSSPTGGTASWQGLAGYINYAFSERFNMTGRAEWFEDAEGIRTGTAQKLWEITLTGECKVTENFKVRLEYRHDESDENVFEEENGSFSDSQDTIALQTIFMF